MPPRSTDHRLKSLKWLRPLACAALLSALACGPNFPNRLLLMGDSAVLCAPTAEFTLEVKRFAPKTAPFISIPPTKDSSPQQQSADADLADLRAALGQAANQDLLDAYSRIRAQLAANTKTDDLPPNLPAEFSLYLRGLIHHHTAHPAEARALWTQLLSLPDNQRRYRSTWAAFMLGKSFLPDDPAQAITHFQRTRALAAAGFPDPLGLAASSLGWEARAELDLGHLTRATDLYLQQLASGDPTSAMSLRLVAARIAAGDPRLLDTLAADLPTQRLITAYIVARGGSIVSYPRPLTKDFTAAWLATLERTTPRDTTTADRIAWAAYQNADFEATDRWLKLADENAPLALWLRAKLLLRAGKLDDAAALLARASRAFPANETWSWLGAESEDFDTSAIRPANQTLGESGVILLTRRHYTEALDALLRAGFWGDAAYIAERVLTTDELRAYIDRTWPPDRVNPEPHDEYSGSARPEHYAADLRYLLARRLIRLQRFDEAAPYLPVAFRDQLASLATSLRSGRDKTQPAAKRATALWSAALLTRDRGLELLGTEMAPDAGIYGGNFAISFDRTPGPRQPPQALVPASPDELERASSSAPDPNRRFHYRFIAAQIAWEAAELLPDNDTTTAAILCTAGTWLKALDPKQADRFYKALARRCPSTDLGKEATRLHWFPKLDDYTK